MGSDPAGRYFSSGDIRRRVPDQETDHALLGIGRGDPHTNLATTSTNADATAYADEAGEILVDVGFSLDRQASIASEASLNTADDWNGRQALKLQMGRKSLFRRYNHRSFLL